MTQNEYNWFYIFYIITGSANPLLRHQHTLDGKFFNRHKKEIEKLPNYHTGIKLLILVSILESNFLHEKNIFSKLRKFEHVDLEPKDIDLKKISCLIYLRDCVAHNPMPRIYDDQEKNTQKFLENYKAYNLCAIDIDLNITFSGNIIHEAHLMLLQFFNEKV